MEAQGKSVSRFGQLRKLASDKLSLALPWPDLLKLDELLADGFGIRQIPKGISFEAYLRSICGEKITEQFCSLTGEGPKFYEWMSKDPIAGAIHSQKRMLILDAIAECIAIVNKLGISGTCLDIGCNTGYAPIALSSLAKVNVVGTDMSLTAIRSSKQKVQLLAGDDISPTFVQCQFPDDIKKQFRSQRFDLVYSLWGGIYLKHDHIMAASRLLNDDGILLCVGDTANRHTIDRIVKGTGLDLAFADVVGGWDGQKFIADSVFVFAKANGEEKIDDPIAESKSGWDDSSFKIYTNKAETPWEEKGQAFFRTFSQFGSRSDAAA